MKEAFVKDRETVQPINRKEGEAEKKLGSTMITNVSQEHADKIRSISSFIMSFKPNVLVLDGHDNNLVITCKAESGNPYHAEVELKIPAEIEIESRPFGVNPELFLNTVRAMKGTDAEIYMGFDGQTLTLDNQSATFQLLATPDIPQQKSRFDTNFKCSVEMDGGVFKTLIDTGTCAATTNSIPQYYGDTVDIVAEEGKGVRVVSTNRFLMAVSYLTSVKPTGEIKINLPAHRFKALGKLVDSTKPVKLDMSDKTLRLTTGCVTVHLTRVDISFPRYEDILAVEPNENGYTAKVVLPTHAFTGAVNRIVALARACDDDSVMMNIREKDVLFKFESQIVGTASEAIPAEVTGKLDETIWLGANFLKQMVGSLLLAKNVTVYAKGPLLPLRFTIEDVQDAKKEYILMPRNPVKTVSTNS